MARSVPVSLRGFRTVLLVGMAACAALAVWVAVVGLRAKRCLDGDFDGDAPASSRGITEEGCEIVTESGAVLLIEIDGPPFEAGVAAVLGFVVLGLVLTAVTIRSRGVPMKLGLAGRRPAARERS
jgi:hypothetical protein